MPTFFPGALDTFATATEGVTYLHALDRNDVQDAIMALEKGSQQVINLKTFQAAAAKGDNTTDDTTAIQAWLTAICTTPGAIGFVPPGTYKMTAAVTSPVSYPGPVKIVGVSRDATIFRQATSNVDTFKITQGAGRVGSVQFQDLTIQGPGTGSSGYGLNIEGDLHLTRASVQQAWTNIRLLNGFYTRFDSSNISSAVQDGLLVDTGTTTIVSRATQYSANGRYGVNVPSSLAGVGGTHLRFIGDYFEANASRGIHYDPPSSVGARVLSLVGS